MIHRQVKVEHRTQPSAKALECAKAIGEAVDEAVDRHKKLGLPMVVWKDGKVVWVPAEKLPDINLPQNDQ